MMSGRCLMNCEGEDEEEESEGREGVSEVCWLLLQKKSRQVSAYRRK
jgi:hypothetical protein